MKFSNAPVAHLSNYEVLTHLLESKKASEKLHHLISERAARKAHQARELYPPKEGENVEELEEVPPLTVELETQEDEAERRGESDELRWIETNVLKYLCADYNPTSRQNESGVALLASDLQHYGLTKGEVLQAVNLAPVVDVDLYTVIEKVDDRFAGSVESTLAALAQQINSTLLPEAPAELVALGQGDGGLVLPTGWVTPTIDNKVAGWQDGIAAEEEMFVTEAAWGKDKEEAVDDEPDNSME